LTLLYKNLIDALNIPFQIIGLTETWLNDNNMDCFTMNNYEYFGSNRPEGRGGGVGLYVSKQLEYKTRNDLTKNIEDIIETKFIEIVNNNGKNLIIGVIYRPPNRNFATFESTMNTILEKIDKENKLCYLMGDFNVDLFKSESCDFASQFIEQLFNRHFSHYLLKQHELLVTVKH
jgi:exonuclease III